MKEYIKNKRIYKIKKRRKGVLPPSLRLSHRLQQDV